MAIARPTTKTIISTVDWGVPITDAVNKNTADIVPLQAATTIGVWTAPTFQNGWTNYAGFVTQYRLRGDMVDVRAGIAGGALGAVPAWTMPVGFRPPARIQFPNTTYGGLLGASEIGPTGIVQIYTGSNDNRFIGFTLSYSVTP